MDSLISPAILYTAIAIGAVGVAMALPRARGGAYVLGGLLAAVFFGMVVLALAVKAGEQRPSIFFYVFGLISLGASLRVITHPRPIYAALYFIVTILSTAGLFLLLGAEFLTFALVIIYAGAILITYLFVIMLATQTPTEDAPDALADYDLSAREPIAATVVGFGLLAVLTGMLSTGIPALPASAVVESSPDAVLAVLPKKVERSFEQTGIMENALPMRPGHIDIRTGDALDRSVYAPEIRLARVRVTDLELARARWQAGRAVMVGGEAPAGVEPYPESAMALFAPPHDRIGPTPVPGSDLGEMRVHFPEDLRADNIEAVGFAMLAEHPLAIELAGVILLMALVGAVILARKQIEAGEEERMAASDRAAVGRAA